MQIVDTHVHVIAKDDLRYPQYHVVHFDWVDPHAVDLEELLPKMDAAGVQKATLVQSISGHGYDNRYTLECASKYPGRLSGVGVIDPLEEDAADTVRRLAKYEGMCAVRLFSNHQGEEAFALNDPRTYPVWEVAVELNLPVILYIRYAQLQQLARVLQAFPQIPVAIDHLAMVPVMGNGILAEAEPLLQLARFSNLHLKWTTNHLEWCEEAGFPFLSLFRQFRNHFGAERLMWGSNYPARSQPSYEAMVQKALDAIKPLPVSEQELVIGGTALSLWPELA